MLVGTLNFSVVSTFGADCGLTEMEAKILIPSVQRMMERLPAATAQKASIILDPLIIVTVFVMWGKRIYSVKQAEARQKYAVEPFEQMRANGVAGTTFGPDIPVSARPSESVSNSVASSYQQSNGGANGHTNGVPDEMVTDTRTYAVRDDIRRSFSDDF